LFSPPQQLNRFLQQADVTVAWLSKPLSAAGIVHSDESEALVQFMRLLRARSSLLEGARISHSSTP
jgi:hypothetical protein